MRTAREISAEEENFRIEPMAASGRFFFVRRDPVEPEPVGAIVLLAFRVTGYDQDCDGSLMARLDAVDMEDVEETGMSLDSVGLYPTTTLVVTEDELKAMYAAAKENQ